MVLKNSRYDLPHQRHHQGAGQCLHLHPGHDVHQPDMEKPATAATGGRVKQAGVCVSLW